jgi:PAS domain-containing protein
MAYLFTGRLVEIGGQPMLVGVGIDISARRQAEQALKRLNAELEQRVLARTADLREAHEKLRDTQFAMDSMGIGITWADFETGRFIYANRHLRSALGYTVDELLASVSPTSTPNFPRETFRLQAVRSAGGPPAVRDHSSARAAGSCCRWRCRSLPRGPTPSRRRS